VTLFDLFAGLRSARIKVGRDGGELVVRAPPGALTSAIRDGLRENKATLLRVLPDGAPPEVPVIIDPCERVPRSTRPPAVEALRAALRDPACRPDPGTAVVRHAGCEYPPQEWGPARAGLTADEFEALQRILADAEADQARRIAPDTSPRSAPPRVPPGARVWMADRGGRATDDPGSCFMWCWEGPTCPGWFYAEEFAPPAGPP
jgi:hypothetical protein